MMICVVPFMALTQNKEDSLEIHENAKQRKFNWGISVGSDIGEFGILFTPTALFANEHHQFELGPKFHTSSNKSNNNGARWGIDFSYKYYPNSHSDRFNLYFILSGQYIRGFWENRYFGNSTYNQSEYIADLDKWIFGYGEGNFNNYGITLGYGFQIRIAKPFYLGFHLGAGIGYDMFSGSIVFKDDQSYNIDNVKNNDFNLSALAGLNMGYRF